MLVALVILIMPTTYLAESSLVIDTKSTDPITGTAIPGDLNTTILATQTDIIQSRNVALKVIDQLHLTKDPIYIAKFNSATDGIGSMRDWLAAKFADKVVVKPGKESNVINISFPGKDGETSATLTNAYTEAYIQTSLELQADPELRQSKWFDQQMAQLRQRVDAAQKRLADAQRSTNIVGTSDHIDVDTAKLTEISTQLVTAQQALYSSRDRLEQMNQALAKNEIDALPDILGNALLQTLKTDLARAEATFAEVSSRFDHNHPQYLAAEAEVKTIRAKLATEIETVRGSIIQSAQISQRQVAELEKAQAQQKQALIEEQRKRDSLDVLNREVESAQRAYDAGLQRTNQVRLESQIDQSTVAVLNTAVPPFNPARPRPLLYMILAFAFGLICAAAACVMTEMGDKRVRLSSDIPQYMGLLVLAEIPRLARRKPV